jgi:hypothetical protein
VDTLSVSEEKEELCCHTFVDSVFLKQQFMGHIYKEGKEIGPFLFPLRILILAGVLLHDG